MHPDQIWGNDEKYSKEYQLRVRKATEAYSKKVAEDTKRFEEQRKKEELEREKLRNEKMIIQQMSQNQIVSPFVRQHMEAKIIAAKWALGLSMAATFLFKGQWLMWIAFIIIYFLYINKIKADAIKADKTRKDFGKRK